jgi:Fur family ferric uptake transcriptional regulator
MTMGEAAMPAQGRNTKQKEAIRAAFVAADRPLSHEEVRALAQGEIAGLSVATVYRNVRLLVEDGWLVAVEIPGAPTRYEVAGKEHHHHFQCNLCGRLYELPGCTIELKPRLPRGFRSTGHEFFAYGVCAACA